MLLSKEQRIGALILISIALVVWFTAALWPSQQTINAPGPISHKPHRSWEERKDSMRHVDSVRFAQWAAEREQRYDSFRMADSLRRKELKTILKHRRDSAQRADSLWRDSMGIHFVQRIKKDTIIDLNHCDTVDLLYLRGIGSYTAIQIIRYRELLGGYASPLQLTDEPFGKCHLDSLLTHFTADSNAIQQIHVNSCSIDQLQRHPYLRYHQAKAIYSLRRKNVRLHSIEELRSLTELTDADINRITPYLSFD